VSDSRALWRNVENPGYFHRGALPTHVEPVLGAGGGDSELYLAVGRSWATGLRHTFNGQLVSIRPARLATCAGGGDENLADVWISQADHAQLHDLRAGPVVSGSYLRFVSQKRAAWLTVLTAIIGHVYSLSFWMHSDGVVSFWFSTAAMVVACQINERRSHIAWRNRAARRVCVLRRKLVRWARADFSGMVIASLLVRRYPIPFNSKRLAELFSWDKMASWTALVLSCAPDRRHADDRAQIRSN